MCKLCDDNNFREDVFEECKHDLSFDVSDNGSNYVVHLSNDYIGLSYYMGTYSKEEYDSQESVLEHVISVNEMGKLSALFLKTCDIFEILLTDNEDYLPR